MSGGDWKEMYVAAASGNIELLKYHIENGIDPNYQHPEILCTPLVASIIAGDIMIAEYLLSRGADPNLLSEFDNLTPLQAARQYQRHEILNLLRQAGAVDKPTFWSKIKKTLGY